MRGRPALWKPPRRLRFPSIDYGRFFLAQNTRSLPRRHQRCAILRVARSNPPETSDCCASRILTTRKIEFCQEETMASSSSAVAGRGDGDFSTVALSTCSQFDSPCGPSPIQWPALDVERPLTARQQPRFDRVRLPWDNVERGSTRWSRVLTRSSFHLACCTSSLPQGHLR